MWLALARAGDGAASVTATVVATEVAEERHRVAAPTVLAWAGWAKQHAYAGL
jgi:hypothetical protein